VLGNTPIDGWLQGATGVSPVLISLETHRTSPALSVDCVRYTRYVRQDRLPTPRFWLPPNGMGLGDDVEFISRRTQTGR